MKNGVRFFLVAVLAATVLVVAPGALAEGESYELVSPGSIQGCVGFVVETIDGTVSGCTRRPDGIAMINTEYSAAADGSIVFMANDNTDPASGDQGSIWLVKPDGSSVHLDDSTWDFAPTISYDGSKVVFARLDPATWSSDIYSVNSDGSDLQLVISGGGTNDLQTPSISPDGSAIAYWCGPAEYATSVGRGCGPLTDGTYRQSGAMRANVDGTDARMIVIGGGDALEPSGPSGLSWSPDEQWIALDGLLTVDLGNNAYTAQGQLFTYHTDGSDLFDNADPTRQITHETDGWRPVFPQFSPDGTQLLYMKTVDDEGNQGNFSFMIGVDGTNRRELPGGYGEFIPTAIPGALPPLVDETHVTVPSVATLELGTATQDLAAVNLTVGTVSYEYSSAVDKNSVVSQDPSAGAVAHRTEKRGPPVNLVVSLGARGTQTLCVVPKLKGKRLKAATHAIAAAHCEVGSVRRAFSPKVKKGHVVSERPGSGQTLPDAARVSLTVSKGRRVGGR